MSDMHDWQDAENAMVGPGPVHQSEGAAFAPWALAVDEAANASLLPPADDSVEAVLARQLSAGISAALAPSVPAAITSEATGVSTVASDSAAAIPRDDLEAGIASVFAALHAAQDVTYQGSADAGDSGGPDDSETDAVTFRLLGELDRLWHQHAA
jgi:hypothetical protein